MVGMPNCKTRQNSGIIILYGVVPHGGPPNNISEGVSHSSSIGIINFCGAVEIRRHVCLNKLRYLQIRQGSTITKSLKTLLQFAHALGRDMSLEEIGSNCKRSTSYNIIFFKKQETKSESGLMQWASSFWLRWWKVIDPPPTQATLLSFAPPVPGTRLPELCTLLGSSPHPNPQNLQQGPD